MKNLSNLKENLGVQLNNWRAFWISFIVVFIGVTLSYMGVKIPAINYSFIPGSEIISPLPGKIKIFDSIQPKLEQKENNFKLDRQTSLIKSIYAFEANDFNSFAVADFETGSVLAEKNLSEKTPIASLTKIMTAVVALDLVSANELFEISTTAVNIPPTKIGMILGQKMTLGELLNALMLTSANDAAELIKEGIDKKYGEEVFIKAMNKKADFIGLENSHFTNPQGFDNNEHFSSAEDLLLLTHYALTEYPLITEIVKKDYQYYPENENHKQIDMFNWNGLLGVYPGVFGVKIGNTADAGYTTTVVSEREGKKIIVVGLGAPGVLERDLWAAQLLDLGFEKLGISPANINEEQLEQKYSSWKYW